MQKNSLQTTSFLSKLIKEPLLHFLWIGAGLFFIFYSINGTQEQEDKEHIIISKIKVDALSEAFLKERGRYPLKKEISQIIENEIEEEVLYREAMAMNLDEKDPIIRRRLSQKMRYLFEDITTLEAPSDEILKAFEKEHSTSFTQPAELSFYQVYFDTRLHLDTQVNDLKTLQTTLKKIKPTHAFNLGDRSFLGYSYIKRRKSDVINIFGEDFSKKVFKVEQDKWKGPFKSAFGLHFVYIYDKKDSQLMPFERVKERILEEYKRIKQEEANKAFFKSLRDRYSIKVEGEAS